jgi:hypothetical protein
VVLLRRFNLNFLPNRLNLPPLSFPTPDQIANEKALKDWDQRHRENKKNTGEHPEIEQKAERRIYVAKGSLWQRQRVRTRRAVNLLNERMNNGNVVLLAEERRDREAAPQKSQRLKSLRPSRITAEPRSISCKVSDLHAPAHDAAWMAVWENEPFKPRLKPAVEPILNYLVSFEGVAGERIVSTAFVFPAID